MDFDTDDFELTMSAELRQQGNDLYRSHSYHEALRCYLRALQCDDVSEADKAKIHNNLAACYLKLKKYQDVITNSTLCEYYMISQYFVYI